MCFYIAHLQFHRMPKFFTYDIDLIHSM